MAASVLYSHSPQVFEAASPRLQVPGPTTPIHSPHHSVHSSTSVRTPLQTLSIHEYRKQQSTPLPRIATPPGKTLRRKAATSALNEIGRLPSTKAAQRRDSCSSSRPVHLSHSAHQLTPQNQFLDPRPIPYQVSRCRSAEPWIQGDSISSVAPVDPQVRVRQFGTRKRLPRPPAPTGSELRLPFNVPIGPTRQIRATLPAPLSFLTEESNSSDVQDTPTPSTFSLSRFPQPPHFETPRETLCGKAVSFATTAPATPPATPAIIHYRGASFDLVNPHASLQFHDIVTPSREFDSSELLPFVSLPDSLLSLSEMAPKRPLYGDLSAAHAGIVGRAEETYGSSNLDLPLPPTPAAISPGSSTYTSPLYSPESYFAPPPLAVNKAPNESRFSLRQLTRTLTKKITKSPGTGDEQELKQFRGRGADEFAFTLDQEPLRLLKQTYTPAEESSYFPISPVSPTSPASPASLYDLGSVSGDDDDEAECSRRDSGQNHGFHGLTSILPNDASTEIGRGESSYATVFAMSHGSRPYYDDLASIYASSSVYTGDDRPKSIYQQSIVGNRQSNPFLRHSGMNAPGFVNEYSYSSLIESSHSVSKSPTQELYHHSMAHRDGKTDTISKFIDQYDPGNTWSHSFPSQDSQNTSSLIAPYASSNESEESKDLPETATLARELNQFEFDIGSDEGSRGLHSMERPTREHMPDCRLRLPPTDPAPLPPVFRYDELPDTAPRREYSDMFPNESYTSYGDTLNLLQLPQTRTAEPSVFTQGLEPSSSYSQSDRKIHQSSSSYSHGESQASPQTPQEALDQAELIFDNAATDRTPSEVDIPLMWGKRSSLDLIRSKRLTDGSTRTGDEEKAEWETIVDGSQQGRMSLDSIANYSSREGSRNSLSVAADASLPSWIEEAHVGVTSHYKHSSPLPTHTHPVSSSRLQLAARNGSHNVPDMSTSGPPSSPPVSSTVPVLRFSAQPSRAVDELYALTPWADPYSISDKETQELLASGPNDDILFDSETEHPQKCIHYKFRSHGGLPEGSSPCSGNNDAGLRREHTFEKLTVVGPKGNLTGTPRGTGMHDAGSSVADTSSPGMKSSSIVGHGSPPSDCSGFYVSPFPATESVTRIHKSRLAPGTQHDQPLSQTTFFSNACSMEPVQGSSPLAGPDRRRSLRCSITFQPTRRASRAAVPGQTKLRQMVLAPDARKTMSSQDAQFSRFVSVSGRGRPSTSDTATPLHPTHPSLDTFPTIRSGKTVVAHQHSPRLLCPEREVKEEDEVRRRKLSWLIFACFCILPPCMFLYRMWGDSIIVSVTKGDLGHCTAKSKRAALIAGAVVNIGLITAILVPILVAQALKAI